MKRLLLVGAAALFPAVAMAAPMEINLCTGSEGFPYHVAGQMIAKQAEGSALINVRVIKDTGGTWGNIERTVGGNPQPADYANGQACHAMIGQPDGPVVLKRQNPAAAKNLKQVASLHREYLHVLCNKRSGVEDLDDLESNPQGNGYSVAIGENGSGGWLIWQNFIAEDEDYAAVPTTNESGTIALTSVASGETTCMLVPAGLGNATVVEADNYYGDEILLAEATDKDFNDAKDIRGERLYEFTDIPSKTYRNSLQKGLFGNSVETVSWQAGVYVNANRLADQKAFAEFIKYVNRAKASIQAEFGD